MPPVTSSQPCPRCGTPSEALLPVEAGMRLALQGTSEAQGLPAQVCSNCYAELSNSVSRGFQLRIERDSREKNKLMMWKGRVNLVRHARDLMGQKSYAQAAVEYEKYLRVLEIGHNLQRGELNPGLFNNSVRSKELAVVTSVYWDLVRIYDSHPNYLDRMKNAARKLSEFLPYSPIYPDIVKKAEIFARSARNPQVLEGFLKNTKSQRGPCFIADAAFADDPLAVELFILRRYRDQKLRCSKAGRRLIGIYYRLSPPLARRIARHPVLAQLTRRVLRKITDQLKKDLNSNSEMSN